MPAQKWEYKTMKLDISGWFLPEMNAEEADVALNAVGEAGWELVAAFDVNRMRGATWEVVAMFKRPRG